MLSTSPAAPINSVLVKPAGADCNLACDYCFYRPKRDLYPDTPRPRMTHKVLEALIGQYMRLAGPNASFGWQGGEPGLMGLDFYRQVVELEQRLGFPRQVVGNGFQTNATFIDDDWARFFADYKFLLGVSLDGPQDLHDRHRLTLGGAPTWERVVRSTEVLRRHAVEFNILCMVTQESVTEAERLYRFFRQNDMRYLQFIPLIEPGPEALQPAPYSISPEAYGEFLCRMFDQWTSDWPPEVSIRDFDDLLTVYAGQPMPSCIHQEECGRYFVVEHNGDVYACDFMVEPEWRIGNLLETPLAALVTSAHFRTFAARKAAHPPRCLECTWLALCRGGCQKHRLITSTSVASPSYFCEAYQRFFQHSRRRLRRLADELTGRDRPRPRASKPRKPAAAGGSPGRNDPCPCGSGKKYKLCCLGR
jgi:serine-type anaerobic sulfatase-maturating enzyme